MTKSDDDTAEFAIEKNLSSEFFAPDHPPMDVRLGAATHPGNVRPHNEDHYAVFRRMRSCEMLLTNLPQDCSEFISDHSYGLMIADGMGGHAFGEVASKLALQTVFELFSRATSWVMKYTDLDGHEFQGRVDAYVKQIRQTFRKYGQADPNLSRMGTTLTAAFLLPPHVLFVNVGDSRAYVFRNGKLDQVTRDHTVAQQMIDAGSAPSAVRRFRHILTNSLGAHGHGDHESAEVFHGDLLPGDRLLLCSDGLSDMADDPSIAAVMSNADPQTTCDLLVQLALERGGRDNVTVIVCDLLEGT